MARLALLCVSFLVVVPSAQALEWADLWQRPDQRLQVLIDAEQFEQATTYAQTGEEQGRLRFRAGDYEQAAEAYQRDSAHYNRGTSLVQAGQYAAAIEAFEQVLADAPEYADAVHNREIARKLLQKQQDQQQQQGEGEGEGKSGEPQPPSHNESGADGQSADDSNQSQAQSGDDNTPQASDKESAGDDRQDAESDANDQLDQQPQSAPDQAGHDEAQQAMEQRLQRVPDDPAGLLRSRIQREHQRSYGASGDAERAW